MKAVVFTEYGGPEVLQVKDVEKPVPKKDEVLIKIKANSVNYGDLMVRNFANLPLSKFNMPLPLYFPTRLMFGYNKPKVNILGSEYSGIIESVGNEVQTFKPGDEVFGYRGQYVNSNAEYLSTPAKGTIAIKPKNMGFEEACTIPYGAITALNLLKKVNIQPGHNVLINGASGSIGSYAVQLAKYNGAKVTGVCGSLRTDFVKSLGADHVVDYKQQDFTQNGKTYDLIFDVLGKSSFSKVKKSLNPNGTYLRVSFKTKDLLQMMWTKLVGSKRVICTLSFDKAENLTEIKELIESGKIKSIIDKKFPLEEAAAAHRYIEEGNKKGSIILTI